MTKQKTTKKVTKKEVTIYEKLLNVQQELKAPKNQFNKFANFYYRNCEDILEGLKPLLKKHGLVLVINDKIQKIGDRYYVKAKAKVIDITTGKSISSVARARESEIKKGMDDSQITGATSSYARKYALNGLFAIDDTKDPDSDEAKKLEEKPTGRKYALKTDKPVDPEKTADTKLQCPVCKKWHTGKYPKCLDCWKAEQNGQTVQQTKKIINEDAPPFPDEPPIN